MSPSRTNYHNILSKASGKTALIFEECEGRVSHPAVSGPQNADGSWLPCFMRGKMIWYTKIKESP